MSYNYKTNWLNSYFEGGELPTEWVKKIRRLLVKGSVLDIGCGIGRFIPAFEGYEYQGIDISPRSIEMARKLYPFKDFSVRDIVEWQPTEIYDNIFSWVALQHIPTEYFEQIVNNIKNNGRNFIFCEHFAGTVGAVGEYVFTHPWREYFKIDYVEPISGPVYVMRARGVK